MTKTPEIHNALNAYMMSQQEAKNLLAQILEGLDRHHDVLPDDINWGHVGDLSSMVKELRELAELYA